VLAGVAAVSAADVWAVGGSQTTTGSPTLIEHWDGTSWSVVASPTPGAGRLNGVAGLGGGGLWAVGASSANGTDYYGNLILPQTLVLRR
jgi:hypothetical protein